MGRRNRMPKLKKKITRDFTTIHNTMLRDMRLCATERGLLLTMLSLPDNWNFSIKGLSRILPDGCAKIGKALHNLEAAGYLVRRRVYQDGNSLENHSLLWKAHHRPQQPQLCHGQQPLPGWQSRLG